MSTLEKSPAKSSVHRRIICPTCWHEFPPEKTLWIATHPSLLGDSKLGDYEPMRFLPSRFDVHGNAIDAKGSQCDAIACPKCHLRVPRPNLELQPIFLSIAGTPSAGKSYFLTAMAWQMRQNFPNEFRVSIGDADPICNRVLNSYEELMFFASDQNRPIKLKKTEEHGDNYTSTNMNGQTVEFVSPFLFSMRPLESHPNFVDAARASKILALYDNAGESFAPGKDGVSNPVTQHLGRSQAVFFCYDLMQDPRCRQSLKGKTSDYQVLDDLVTARQELILHEVLARLRRMKHLSQSERTDIPFVVVVTKYDGWKALLDSLELKRPVKQRAGITVLDMTYLHSVNNQVRDLMLRLSPEFVTTVESFSKNAWFIPVSATGVPPELDSATGIIGVRPRDIQPIWCDVPITLVVSRFIGGLVPYVDDLPGNFN